MGSHWWRVACCRSSRWVLTGDVLCVVDLPDGLSLVTCSVFSAFQMGFHWWRVLCYRPSRRTFTGDVFCVVCLPGELSLVMCCMLLEVGFTGDMLYVARGGLSLVTHSVLSAFQTGFHWWRVVCCWRRAFTGEVYCVVGLTDGLSMVTCCMLLEVGFHWWRVVCCSWWAFTGDVLLEVGFHWWRILCCRPSFTGTRARAWTRWSSRRPSPTWTTWCPSTSSTRMPRLRRRASLTRRRARRKKPPKPSRAREWEPPHPHPHPHPHPQPRNPPDTESLWLCFRVDVWVFQNSGWEGEIRFMCWAKKIIYFYFYFLVCVPSPSAFTVVRVLFTSFYAFYCRTKENGRFLYDCQNGRGQGWQLFWLNAQDITPVDTCETIKTQR